MAQSFSIQGNIIKYMPNVEEIIHLFFPQANIVADGCADYHLEFNLLLEDPGNVRVKLHEQRFGKAWHHLEQRQFQIDLGMKDETMRMLKVAVFRLLQNVFPHLASPWGILRGIRPTKLVHQFLDRGLNEREIIEMFQVGYGLQEEKVRLLLQIAIQQRPFLLSREEMLRKISIYIGIPFCPTRCVYCSFISCTLKQGEKWLEDYMKALHHEINEIGQWMHKEGLIADNIYIGGGTPTVLSLEKLDLLLDTIKRDIPKASQIEYTMEAGRPDSITLENLRMIKAAGINRLCINPQTLNDKTLDIIGRKHSVAEFMQAFNWARQVGFSNINSDLIIGLPGEKAADVQRSLEYLLPLGPENVTVHTMAIKRGSRLMEELEETVLPQAKEVEKMLRISQEMLLKAGYKPYYLYRQQKILAHLENTGYTLSGHVCSYNIQMIEERQNILGLGAGASSKFVSPDLKIIKAVHHPKDPKTYIDKVEGLIQEKIVKMRTILTRV